MKQWIIDNLVIVVPAALTICGGIWKFIKWLIDRNSKKSETALRQSNKQTQNIVVNVNESQKYVGGNGGYTKDDKDIDEIKMKTIILFIDDDKTFKIVKIIKNAGWNLTSMLANPDVKNINDERIKRADIIFVDIKGVAKTLYADEGLGLAQDLKKEYPNKKVVLYSGVPEHQISHPAIRLVDEIIDKNAQPAEFISVICSLAEQIWRKE